MLEERSIVHWKAMDCVTFACLSYWCCFTDKYQKKFKNLFHLTHTDTLKNFGQLTHTQTSLNCIQRFTYFWRYSGCNVKNVLIHIWILCNNLRKKFLINIRPETSRFPCGRHFVFLRKTLYHKEGLRYTY